MKLKIEENILILTNKTNNLLEIRNKIIEIEEKIK